MTFVEELMTKLLRPPRVMLAARDEPSGQTFVSALREQFECDLDWVITGKHGVELINRKCYDIVFVDLSLAGDVPGKQLIKAIRQQKPSLPIVTMLDAESADDFVEVVGCGLLGSMRKPLGNDDLNFDTIFRTYSIRAVSKQDTALTPFLATSNSAHSALANA